MMNPTIVSEQVDVRIRPLDREESTQSLQVKIVSSSAGPTPRNSGLASSSGLTIEVTSESDLFFFYSLKLTESDFHALKQEQRLLVDFHQFPAMVRDLLRDRRACMSVVLSVEPSGGAQTGCCSDGSAVLSILEANQFRELTLLSLRLRRGNDESIKSYLATRLSQMKNNASALEAELAEANSRYRALQTDRETTQCDLSKFRAEHESTLASVHANCQSRIAQLKEEHAREIRELHLSTSSEYSVETRRLSDEVRDRDGRTRDLEKRLEDTRVTLVSVENSFKTSQQRVSSLERIVDVGRDELKRREVENRDLVTQHYAMEKRIAELTMEVNGLTQQLASKELVIQNSTQLVDQSTGQCKQLEVTLSTTRASVAQYNERIRELEHALAEKDNQASKLSNRNKQLKAAVKQAQQALLRQEQVVVSLNKDLAALGGEKERVAQLADDVTKQKSQLHDAHQLLQSNSQVISYLNKKLGERDGSIFGTSSALPALTNYIPSLTAASLSSTMPVGPVITPSPPLVERYPEFPNRSTSFLTKMDQSSLSAVGNRSTFIDQIGAGNNTLPNLSQYLSSSATPSVPKPAITGPVKFTARTGTKDVIMK